MNTTVDEPETPRTRRKLGRPVLAGLSAALGFVVAATLFSLSGATAGPATLAASSHTADGPGVVDLTTPRAVPETTETATPDDGTPVDGAAPGTAAPEDGGSDGSSDGGSAGSSSSGGGLSAGAAPAPEPAAGPGRCPDSEGENPAMWAACRAGYVAPSITFGGVVSCTPIDRAAGIWAISVQWNVSGGHYIGSLQGLSNNATGFDSFTMYDAKPDSMGGPVMMPGATVEMEMESMNGLPGPRIDLVVSSPAPGL